MFSFLILFIFVYFCYAAYRNGLPSQALATLGYIISFIIAFLLYKPLSKTLNLWIPYPSANYNSKFAFFDQNVGLTLDKTFYAAIAFTLVLIIGCMIWHFFMHGFDNLKYIKIDPKVNAWSSVILSFCITLINVYLLIFILATIPMQGLQQSLEKSTLVNLILRYTPGISHLFVNLFVVSI